MLGTILFIFVPDHHGGAVCLSKSTLGCLLRPETLLTTSASVRVEALVVPEVVALKIVALPALGIAVTVAAVRDCRSRGRLPTVFPGVCPFGLLEVREPHQENKEP